MSNLSQLYIIQNYGIENILSKERYKWEGEKNSELAYGQQYIKEF